MKMKTNTKTNTTRMHSFVKIVWRCTKLQTKWKQ